MLEISLIYLPQIIYESTIFFSLVILSLSLYRKWVKKRTLISKYLSICFFLYFLATFNSIFIQLIERVFISFSLPWLLYVIVDQAHLIISMLANWYYFKFFKEVYSIEQIKTIDEKKFTIFTFSIIILSFVLIFEHDLITFINLILLVQSFLVFLPSVIETRKVLKSVQLTNPSRLPFKALYFMSWFFILLWLSVLFDGITTNIIEMLYGPFFYLSWGFIFLSVFTAYLGFIYPKWYQRMMQKQKR
ncbi:MAG: hypothetical protein ACTSVI_05470 [Promethearchaeota archaeon]